MRLAGLFVTLGLEPLAPLAKDRGAVGQLVLHSGGRISHSGGPISAIFLCAREKTSAMEYGRSFASLAFNANHTAVPLIGRTL